MVLTNGTLLSLYQYADTVVVLSNSAEEKVMHFVGTGTVDWNMSAMVMVVVLQEIIDWRISGTIYIDTI